MIQTYSWDELKSMYSSFINEDYYNTEEIQLPNNYYLNIEMSNWLGKQLEGILVKDQYFTPSDGGAYLPKSTIKT